MEIQLSSGESFFSRVLAGLDCALCIVDPSGVIEASNAAFALLAGVTPEAVRGRSLATLLPEPQAGEWLACLAPGAEGDATIDAMLGLASIRRTPVRLTLLGAPTPDSASLLISATPTGDDDSAGTQRALLELTAIFDNASAGILFTRDRVVQRCNQRMAEIFGYGSPDELVGQPSIIVYPDADSFARLSREATPPLSAGRFFHTEWLLRRADDSPVWCDVYGKAVDPAHTGRGTVWIIEDVSEAKRTEEALHQTLREMEAIMRNAPVGIIFTRERRIFRYNPKLARMFGFEGEQGVGLPARVLYRSDEEYQALGQVAAPLLSQGQPFQTELFMRRQDGSDFWVNLIGYVQNLDDPAEGTIWICEDRSAFKQAEERLQQANAELVDARDRAEVANRAKSDFLAKMSHELRTPLNAVLGYAQILKREKALTERAALGLNTIEQSGQHLLTLINDILDLSRIEAGRLDLEPGVVYLPSFLRVVADIVRVKAEQKDLLFDFDASPELPRAVRADEKRLRQVLLNLLSNAVKFTDRGMVSLDVRALSAPAGLVRLRFQIRDTGIGIDMQRSSRLFQPFEQLGETARRAGGTGLGLAISRELVRAMGGDIEVTSTPGVGSSFSFELALPLVEAAAAMAPRERVVTGYEGPRKKILIVDDIAENRALMVDFLGMLDFATAEASDGLTGLEQARAMQPDLILMDNVMPVMSGLEATRRLRQQEAFANAPIIAISASASQADRERSLAVGVDAFLHKPIDFNELLKSIQSLLQVTWTYQDDTTPPSGASAPGALLPPPREEMEVLHRLAMMGNMREIRARAAHLAALDARYAPFAMELNRLALGYQSNAIRRLVEQHLDGGPG